MDERIVTGDDDGARGVTCPGGLRGLQTHLPRKLIAI